MKLDQLGVAILLAMYFLSSVARAGDCSGNGCKYIEIQKRGGCIVIANSHSIAIRVRPKNVAGVSSGTVYASSDYIPKYMDGSCVTSYNFDYSAVLTGSTGDEACKKVRPLSDLGYGEGHKTKFCKRKGYAGVTNFKGSDYHDYGGGFCYTGDKKACLELMKGYSK